MDRSHPPTPRGTVLKRGHSKRGHTSIQPAERPAHSSSCEVITMLDRTKPTQHHNHKISETTLRSVTTKLCTTRTISESLTTTLCLSSVCTW